MNSRLYSFRGKRNNHKNKIYIIITIDRIFGLLYIFIGVLQHDDEDKKYVDVSINSN